MMILIYLRGLHVNRGLQLTESPVKEKRSISAMDFIIHLPAFSQVFGHFESFELTFFQVQHTQNQLKLNPLHFGTPILNNLIGLGAQMASWSGLRPMRFALTSFPTLALFPAISTVLFSLTKGMKKSLKTTLKNLLRASGRRGETDNDATSPWCLWSKSTEWSEIIQVTIPKKRQ